MSAGLPKLLKGDVDVDLAGLRLSVGETSVVRGLALFHTKIELKRRW